MSAWAKYSADYNGVQQVRVCQRQENIEISFCPAAVPQCRSDMQRSSPSNPWPPSSLLVIHNQLLHMRFYSVSEGNNVDIFPEGKRPASPVTFGGRGNGEIEQTVLWKNCARAEERRRATNPKSSVHVKLPFPPHLHPPFPFSSLPRAPGALSGAWPSAPNVWQKIIATIYAPTPMKYAPRSDARGLRGPRLWRWHAPH